MAHIHYFNVHVACEVSVDAAILFQNITFWVEKNQVSKRNLHEGRYWTYNSRAAYATLFPYLNPSRVRRAIEKLVDKGWLLQSNFNKRGCDRTHWHTLTDDSAAFVKQLEDANKKVVKIRIGKELSLPRKIVLRGCSFFNTQLAAMVGIEAAVLFSSIAYWIDENASSEFHCREGRPWTLKTVAALVELFPYMLKSKVRHSLSKLKEKGFLLSGRFNEDARDNTTWYALTDEAMVFRGTGEAPGETPSEDWPMELRE
jgi:hypothetical protein